MSSKQNQGFTLVELITIVILLGIVSAYASSRFLVKAALIPSLLSKVFPLYA